MDGTVIFGECERVTEYGELASVVLYRDVRGDRWKYAIYDSVGVRDGWLPDLPAESDFEIAAAALMAFVHEHWRQPLPTPWVPRQDGWWSAGPAPL